MAKRNWEQLLEYPGVEEGRVLQRRTLGGLGLSRGPGGRGCGSGLGDGALKERRSPSSPTGVAVGERGAIAGAGDVGEGKGLVPSGGNLASNGK